MIDAILDGVPLWGDVSGLDITEDSTPLLLSDTTGSTGGFSFEFDEFQFSDTGEERRVDAKDLDGKAVELRDSERGVLLGVVSAASIPRRGRVKVECDTVLAQAVQKVTAQPHVGTLESLVAYYFGLCGIVGVTVDPAVASIPVVVRGWYAVMWLQLKAICVAHGVEITLSDGVPVVRPPRTKAMGREVDSSFRWGVDRSRRARAVATWFYPSVQITNTVVLGRELTPISNLDAGEVHEFEQRLDVSLSSVDQPSCVSSVAFGYSGTASVYAVLDNRDRPVDPAYWRDQGGLVSFEIGEDTTTLKVRVVGMQDRRRAPFRLAAKKINGREYSTLRAVGSGVRFQRRRWELPACVDDPTLTDDVPEFDNYFLSSKPHAHLALLGAAIAYSGALARIDGQVYELAPFGDLAGARILDDGAFYRNRTTGLGPAAASYTAEGDTTLGDVSAIYGDVGGTIADFNARWGSGPIKAFNTRPLST